MVLSSGSGDEGLSIELDCMIYVDSNDCTAALRVIASSAGGAVGRYEKLETEVFRIYATHNDYDVGASEGSGFVAWPSVLECEPVRGVDAAQYVTAIGSSLTALWDAGFRAVAACDFEDRLPDAGGLQRYL
jgi:hypothetical protein